VQVYNTGRCLGGQYPQDMQEELGNLSWSVEFVIRSRLFVVLFLCMFGAALGRAKWGFLGWGCADRSLALANPTLGVPGCLWHKRVSLVLLGI